MWRRLIGRDDEGRTLFRDRGATGKALALLLTERGVEADLVLAIPRGGLEVAEPVARLFALPLDVLVSRKVSAPDQPELALGSVTRLGAVWNEEVLAARRISAETQARLSSAERDEVERRERAFRGARAAEPVDGRRVLLVDDGLATGATAAAAVQAGLAAGAAAVVVAVPLAPREAVARLERLGAEVVAVATPEPFGAVGTFYEDFRAVPQERCIEILRRYTSAS
jgi:putative phosphoribosyl transferase